MPSHRTRIVYLHPSDDWYGSDRVAWESVNALVEQADVQVLVPDDIVATAPLPLSQRLEVLGVAVRRRPLPVLRRALMTPWGLMRLFVILLRFALTVPRADVYLVNTAALALCVPVLRLRRAHVVVHLHETLSAKEGAVLGAALRSAHRVLTVSESAQSRLPGSLRSKASVLRNFVPAAERVPLPSGPPLRAVFVGRLTPRKGIAELVAVWRDLDPANFHLTVVGGPPVSGSSAALDTTALDRLPHVEVIGEVENPQPHVDQSHVVVLPSLLPEGLPMVGLEALGRGRPLVATTAGGLAELVTPETGWELQPDPASWREVFEGLTVGQVVLKQDACVALCRSKYSREQFVDGLLKAVEPSR